MADPNDKKLLELCLSKHLLDKKTAAAVYQRAQNEGRGAGEVLADMGMLAQHTIEALKREVEQALLPRSFAGFRIIRKLGQGGMGSVYLAEQVSLHREVALKVIAPQFSADVQAVDRFMREARTAAAINHPNIISVIDVGYDHGQLYMALELVSGGDAAQLASRFNGVLPEARALEIISDCCRGLGALYEARLIHRDIKPANIFITRDGIAKLADLGLARSEQGDDRLTVSGHTVGTPAFMSPEQASGKTDIDIRSDIYSLGAALFALTTGSPPFTGNGIFAIAAKLLTEPAPDPRSLNPVLSAATGRVITRCLAKRPAERFQTPHELFVALAEAMAGLSTGGGVHLAAPSTSPSRVGAGPSHPTPATVPPRRTRPGAARKARRALAWPIVGGIVIAMVVAPLVARTGNPARTETSPEKPGPVPGAQVVEQRAPAKLAQPAVRTAVVEPPVPALDLAVSPHPSASEPAQQKVPVAPTAAPKGLIAYWPLDEGTGMLANDHSGGSSNGTLSNATWGPGNVGGGLIFSKSSRVLCGNPGILTPVEGITVMCWVKTKQSVWGKESVPVVQHEGHFTALQLNGSGNAHVVAWGSGSLKWAEFPWRGIWDDDHWHHYAATYHQHDGVKVYMDGRMQIEAKQVAGALPAKVSTSFMLGGSELNNEYFVGSLDEVRVYDRPLSSAEIQAIAALNAPAPSVSAGLVAYWPFDEAAGKKAQDRSGKGSDGTIIDAAWGPGVVGTGLAFTPPSKVLCGNSQALAPGAISVTCWLRTTVRAKGLEPISVIRHDGHFTALQLMPDGTAQAVIWAHGHADMMIFAWDGEWNDDRWHHYTVSYHQEQGGQIFKDGKLLKTFPKLVGALQPPTAPFVIGGSELAGEYFAGSLDEVRVYDRILSAQEVATLAAVPAK